MNAAVASSPSEVKVVATLVARAALAGYELVRMADGSFVISRWGLIRNLASIDDVTAFLALVGAA